MAVHEKENERVVFLFNRNFRVVRLREAGVRPLCCHDILTPAPCHLAPHVVRDSSCCDLVQSAEWVFGNPLHGPLRGSRHESLLHRVLRGGEIIMPARYGGEHMRRKIAQQVLCRRDVAGGITRRSEVPT